ncbi:MAG: hypothetical protein FOGNACKC_00831 [Anaerolineae bacterium]|nr:hypothetical protein [Anaerolineae bacterium]
MTADLQVSEVVEREVVVGFQSSMPEAAGEFIELARGTLRVSPFGGFVVTNADGRVVEALLENDVDDVDEVDDGLIRIWKN